MSVQIFRGLHQGSAVLVLPNAWDAGTARLIESIGAKAIATTSAGLAWARGYPDGNALPEDQLLAAIRAIARVIRVPLSTDIEAGYSEEPDAVASLVTRLLDIGVVGINIEDGAGSPVPPLASSAFGTDRGPGFPVFCAHSRGPRVIALYGLLVGP